MTITMILSGLLRDERGATAVEYGLICAMIVLVMLGALGSVAEQINLMWNNVSTRSAEAITEDNG